MRPRTPLFSSTRKSKLPGGGGGGRGGGGGTEATDGIHSKCDPSRFWKKVEDPRVEKRAGGVRSQKGDGRRKRESWAMSVLASEKSGLTSLAGKNSIEGGGGSGTKKTTNGNGRQSQADPERGMRKELNVQRTDRRKPCNVPR